MTDRDTTTASLTPSASFLGRTAEFGALTHALQDARDGLGGLVLISGEAGIGKTRLTDELLAGAKRSGVGVLRARCHEGEGAPPFWPWIQIIRGLRAATDPDVFTRAMGAGDETIGLIVPELASGEAPEESVVALPEQTRFLLFDAVTTLITNLARHGPLAVSIDDVHWADEPTLKLLEFFAGEARDASLLLVATYRDAEGGDRLERWLGSLIRFEHVRRISLTGLTSDEVSAYVAQETGTAPSPEVASLLHQRTAGNPFFLSEIVRQLSADGEGFTAEAERALARAIPAGVHQTLKRRLASLAPVSRAVLEAAAVIGGEFEIDVLHRVCELQEAVVRQAVRDAMAAGILAQGAEDATYVFTHALVRDALYEELPDKHRRLLHFNVAHALEDICGGDPEPRLSELALHFDRAGATGDLKRAVLYLAWAGQSAIARFAYEEAVQHLERARSILEQPGQRDDKRLAEVLIDLGEAQRRSGKTVESTQILLDAAAVARALDDPKRLARAGLAIIPGRDAAARRERDQRPHVAVAQTDQTVAAILEEALDELDRPEVVLRVQVMARLAVELYLSGELERSAKLSLEAVALARGADNDRALGAALVARFYALWTPDHTEERLALADEILDVAGRTRDVDLDMAARRFRIATLVELGDMDGLARELDTLENKAHGLRQPLYRWWAAISRVLQLLIAGRYAEAEIATAAALDWGERGQDATAFMYYGVQTALIRRDQGRLADIEMIFDGFAAEFSSIPSLRAAISLLQAELGNESAARAEFDRFAADGFGSIPRDSNWSLAVGLLAATCARLGDAGAAATLYSILLPYAQNNVVAGAAVGYLGPVSLYLGELATCMGDWEDSQQRFQAAIDLCTRMGARPVGVRARLGRAGSLLGRGAPGDRQDALDLLDDVVAEAEALEMDAILTEAKNLKTRTMGVEDSGLKTTLETMVRSEQPALEEIKRLARIAEFRDDQTGAHLARMSAYAEHLGRAAGFSETEVKRLYHAAHLHDIGKMAIPDSVLLKRGSLTEDEWAIMRSHTELGARMLAGSSSPTMQMAEEIALTHHEKFDGSGYPAGLVGEQIPLVGRICAISDAFDAITSHRPYKEAFDPDFALEELHRSAGAHFDPDLIALFEKVYDGIVIIHQRFSDRIQDAAG